MQTEANQIRTAALVVAAGRGTRALGDARRADALPKQYAEVSGRCVLSHTLHALADNAAIDAIQVVIHPADDDLYRRAIGQLDDATRARLLPSCTGGATRQASVMAGLEALAARSPAFVLIHDAARPFLTCDIVDRVIAALADGPAAIAALPVTDTLKRATATGIVDSTIDRQHLWRAQTPQGFHFKAILDAHRAAAGGPELTDDAAVAEAAGLAVRLVEGSAANTKITTPEDLVSAAQALSDQRTSVETRTGQGFDVHRFTTGDHVWLGGVRIAHSHALDGHSDADVVLHALTDALLGTIGDGDIGQHFPPSDPKWKGAASHLFLADAARRVRDRGGRIVNVDVTLLCEAPRIGPHRTAMQARIAEILGLDTGRVGVKATTTEQLGFTGRREGIAAMAIATVSMPSN